jgi:hypothetical protein
MTGLARRTTRLTQPLGATRGGSHSRTDSQTWPRTLLAGRNSPEVTSDPKEHDHSIHDPRPWARTVDMAMKRPALRYPAGCLGGAIGRVVAGPGRHETVAVAQDFSLLGPASVRVQRRAAGFGNRLMARRSDDGKHQGGRISQPLKAPPAFHAHVVHLRRHDETSRDCGRYEHPIADGARLVRNEFRHTWIYRHITA